MVLGTYYIFLIDHYGQWRPDGLILLMFTHAHALFDDHYDQYMIFWSFVWIFGKRPFAFTSSYIPMWSDLHSERNSEFFVMIIMFCIEFFYL